MKNRFSFIAIVSVVFALIGCSDDFGSQSVIKNTGDEIVFGGRAGFEMNEDNGTKAVTRTIYTGKTWTEGEGENQKTYEGVNWIKGDQVRIFCNEAVGAKTADYTVIREEGDTIVEQETGAHQVGLVKNGSVALQWGNTSSPHTFYAVYPSPSQYVGANTAVTEVLNNNTELVGEIPAIQTHLGKYHLTTASTSCKVKITDASGSETEAEVTGTEYTVAPDMKYAYMVAKTKVENPSKADNEVYLKFMPIATAVEITIRNLAKDTDGSTYTFQMANVLVSSANGEPICGQFNTDLNKIKLDANGYGTGFPDDTDTEKAISVEGNSGTQISMPMYQDGIYGDPISLGYGDALTFTVFLLPTQDLNSLKVTIQGLGGNKTATINGVQISKRKKTYLSNIPVAGKDVLPFTQEEWMKYTDNNENMYNLSIPAAGGAASGHAANWDKNAKFLQQKSTITELWNYGVRCFEFTVDRATDDSNDIGGMNVYCNGKDCGITLANAVQLVQKELIAHPQECAIIILTYQDNDGWGTDKRSPSTWMGQVNTFWTKVREGNYHTDGGWPEKEKTDGIKTGTALYNHGSTMQDCRGKLFCIARPTSEYEDNHPVETYEDSWDPRHYKIYKHIKGVTYDDTKLDPGEIDEHILVIKGWGAMKDKFERRGYTTCHYHRGTGHADYAELKNYIAAVGDEKAKEEIGYIAGAYGRPFDVASNASGINTISKDYITSKLETLNPNFDYPILPVASTGQTYAWVQEWARVSKMTEALAVKYTYTNWIGIEKEETKAFFWAPSYKEKLQHVKNCLSASIADNTGKLYINSLCGYYIDLTDPTNDPNSFYPNTLSELNGQKASASNCYASSELTGGSSTAGMSGDIAAFAKQINKDFYDHLQAVTSYPVPGSMGIVMLDRVGEDEYSKKIPGIIVANNFQHKTAQTRAIPKGGNYQNDDTKLSRKQHGSATNGQMSITWE